MSLDLDYLVVECSNNQGCEQNIMHLVTATSVYLRQTVSCAQHVQNHQASKAGSD